MGLFKSIEKKKTVCCINYEFTNTALTSKTVDNEQLTLVVELSPKLLYSLERYSHENS